MSDGSDREHDPSKDAPDMSQDDEQTNIPDVSSNIEQKYEKGRTRRIYGSGVGSALRCMVSFFTIIRLDVGEAEMDAMERKFWLVPAVGFLIGLVAALVCLVFEACGLNSLTVAVAALATVYLFSKFLHFDGLTDFGDGMIVSSGKREDHIRALKDSLIGAGGFGVGLIVVIMTVVLYNQMEVFAGYAYGTKLFGIGSMAFCAEILVKNAQVAAAAFGEPGNGMASRQVRYTDTRSLMKSTVLTAVLLIVPVVIGTAFFFNADAHTDLDGAAFLLLYLISIILSIVVGYVMARTANRTFGFVNGDILGATNEISRCVILLFSVLVLGLILT